MVNKSFSISNLKTMEIVDISIGAKLGYINDFKVDTKTNRILSIILMQSRTSWFSRNNFIEIPWDNIKKIGVDFILVDGMDLNLDKLDN